MGGLFLYGGADEAEKELGAVLVMRAGRDEVIDKYIYQDCF